MYDGNQSSTLFRRRGLPGRPPRSVYPIPLRCTYRPRALTLARPATLPETDARSLPIAATARHSPPLHATPRHSAVFLSAAGHFPGKERTVLLFFDKPRRVALLQPVPVRPPDAGPLTCNLTRFLCFPGEYCPPGRCAAPRPCHGMTPTIKPHLSGKWEVTRNWSRVLLEGRGL